MSVIGIIIIMLIIILGIISFIVDLISKPFKSILLNLRKREMKDVEKNISATIMTDPQKAFQMVVDNQNIISYSQYANLLTLIAEKSGHIGAMKKLIELYHGDILSCFADKDKYEYWLERVAKLGHIASIVEYYKFSDYDVSSTAYEEILQALDHVRPNSKEEMDKSAYLKGIIQYKLGHIDAAKQIFEQSVSEEYGQCRDYMLLQCAIKQSHFSIAKEILDKLEKDNFQIPADVYLRMYEYYTSKRNSSNQDYESEIQYTEKYIACKDSDHDTANTIAGDSYYNLAVSLQNKNKEKALSAYKKAADYGNPNALYYLGNYYWSGVNPRNYYLAIQYMLKASQVGHRQAKLILDQYGFEGILIKTMQTTKTEYSFSNGYILTASVKTLQWLQMYYGIKYQGRYLATVFVDNYFNEFKSFDQMVNGINQLYMDYISYMLKWCIKLLMSFNIDIYGPEDIIEQCEDLSLFPRVPKFEQGLEEIDNKAKMMDAKMNYVQSTRRAWTGVGFGTTISSTIKATVKANVAAGMMNIGSDILHGIGDSIVKSSNNAELKKMGDKLFENPETIKEFKNAVLSAYTDIASVIMHIMEEHCKMELNLLEGSIIWSNEDLSEIDNRVLHTKIDNNLAAENYEYAYALLLEALRRTPIDSEIFQKIFELTIRQDGVETNKAYESCLRYAGDFNLKVNDLQST